MNDLNFYPLLTDKIKEDCGCTADKYIFTYNYQGKAYGLRQKGSSVVHISDPLEIWKIESEGITFEKTISIAYPRFLFGKHGIACSDAELGICIIWINKTLTQRGCFLPESDKISSSGRKCVFRHTFLPGEVKGDLELTVSFYIKKKADNVGINEENLMNEEGVSVGEIETVVLDFDSIYMEFPIEECNSKDEPLWWVEFSQWEDPKTIDLFNNESFCLYLNSYYDACPMVGEHIKNFDLLTDILATTYLMLFKRLSEDDLRATKNNIGLENNTICSILHQFIEECNAELHFESPEKLLKSLQSNIRHRLTEDGDE